MTAQTQTAHIAALYFGLTPEEYKETTVNGLLKQDIEPILTAQKDKN